MQIIWLHEEEVHEDLVVELHEDLEDLQEDLQDEVLVVKLLDEH